MSRTGVCRTQTFCVAERIRRTSSTCSLLSSCVVSPYRTFKLYVAPLSAVGPHGTRYRLSCCYSANSLSSGVRETRSTGSPCRTFLLPAVMVRAYPARRTLNTVSYSACSFSMREGTSRTFSGRASRAVVILRTECIPWRLFSATYRTYIAVSTWTCNSTQSHLIAVAASRACCTRCFIL